MNSRNHELLLKISADVTKLKAGLEQASTSVRNFESKINSSTQNIGKGYVSMAKNSTPHIDKLANKLHNGLAIATKAGVAAVAAGAIATIKAAADYESAFAGVRKTIDATEQEYSELSTSIRKMSKEIPSSAAEIAKVAEVAGQLGIQKENIIGFTRTVIDLGNATNLVGEEGAMEMARFANIVSMNQKDFSRLGSTIVDLGNKTATTERDIMSMGMRLAGAGKQVGLTVPQIMGLAATLSSLGVEAEMGGSAFSRLMVKMNLAAETGDKADRILKKTGMNLRELQMMASHNTKGFGKLAKSLGYTKEEFRNFIDASAALKAFSSVTGKTSAEFKKAFKDDAAGAIATFIGGLGKSQKQGKSAIKVLDDMGITEVRLRDAILRASNAEGMMAKTLKISSEAWDENKALSEEAAKRYQTFESQSKILKNTLTDMGISIGSRVLPKLNDLVRSFRDKLPNAVQNIKTTIKTFGPVVIGATASIATYKTILIATEIKTKALTVATKLLHLAMAHPIAAVVAGVIGLGTALASNKAITESSIFASNRLRKARENLKTATDNLKIAENNLSEAKTNEREASLNAEQATINLEQARKRTTEILKQYGSGSIEYRQAQLDEKRAIMDVETAEKNKKKAIEETAKAQDEIVKKKEAIKKAESEVRNAINDTTSRVSRAKKEWEEYNKALDRYESAKGRHKGNVPIPTRRGAGSNRDAYFLQPRKRRTTGKRATGGPVSANQPYLVGENPDGSINRTTELFIPSSSGYIMNSRNLKDALQDKSEKSTIYNQTINLTLAVEPREGFGYDDAVNMIKQINGVLKSQGLKLNQLGAVR